MNVETELPKRKMLRLQNFDYNTNGAYFITICTKDRKNLLSKIITVIRSFKTMVTKEIGFSIWQRSFYDHVIRNHEDYLETTKYIQENPEKWIYDE